MLAALCEEEEKKKMDNGKPKTRRKQRGRKNRASVTYI